MSFKRTDGNVGIGTTNPGAKLDVIGAAGAQAMRILKDSTWDSESAAGLAILDSAGTDTGLLFGADATNNIAYIQSIDPGTSYSTRPLAINAKGGNVGIGTTSPGLKLHIVGDTALPASSGSDQNGGLRVAGAGTNYVLDMGVNNVAGSAGAWIQSTYSTTLSPYPLMLNPNGGNVGIGTTAPGAKLDIAATTSSATLRGGGTTYFDIYGNTADASDTKVTRIGGGGDVDTARGSFIAMYGNEHATAGLKGKLVLRSGSAANATAGDSDIDFIPGPTGISAMLIQGSDGNVGIGTTAPGAKLEVVGANDVINLEMADATADAANKESRIGATHYTNSEEALTIMGSGITNTTSLVEIGGGFANMNAATQIDFYTAANNTTLTGTNRMVIKSDGNVGIGTTVPNQALDVIGTIQASNLLGGALNITTDANGNIIRDPSDARLKENIQPITGALDKVMRLRGVTYNWKDRQKMGSQTDYGMIAQEVAAVTPELTATSVDGIMGVKYTNMVGLLVNAVREQQGMIIEEQAKNTEQDTAIVDMNLKTTQNVETVQGLQKSVDENLAVISGNFSNVQSQLVLQDSQLKADNSRLANLDTEVSNISSQVSALSSQYAILDTKYSDLDSGMTLSESERIILEARIIAAEDHLKEAEKNMATFETSTNDTISSMLETENMLTERILSHEDRLKALEEEMATMTITGGGSIPSNVVTQDALGNVTLAGIFEAKEVVAGAYAVKNDNASKKTAGDDAVAGGENEKSVSTKAVSETAKVFVTFESDPGARYWIEKTKDPDTGEYTGFAVKLSTPTETDANAKFSWWIVEEK